MSMCIGGAASSTATTSWQNRRQNFGSLVSSIKNGDLTGAQQAFAALSGVSSSTTTPDASDPAATSTTTSGNSNSPQGDLAAIGQALDKGDITGAQQALAKLFADRAGGGGHHHHHGGAAPAAAASTGAPTPTPSVSSSSTISILA